MADYERKDTLIEHDAPHLECLWFAGCFNPVRFERSHPILDWVPVCAVHALAPR